MHEKSIPGMYGIGKVRIKYVQKKKRSTIGLYVFLFGIYMSVLLHYWHIPSVREYYILPPFRMMHSMIDWARLQFSMDFSQENVFIQRDNSSGMPTIEAETIDDLLFSQGYMHCKDRMFQMEILRLTAIGNMSVEFGDKFMNSDKVYKTLNLKDRALRDLSHMDSDSVNKLQSYANGINNCMNSMSYKNFEFGLFTNTLIPWQPSDSLLVLRLLMLQWSHGVEDNILDAYLHLVDQKDVFKANTDEVFDIMSKVSHFMPSVGGKVMAISSQLTKSAGAILINDIDGMVRFKYIYIYLVINMI